MTRKLSRVECDSPAASGRSVQSVDRAVGMVAALAGAREGLSLTELAQALGLAVQTAQSLVRTLQRHGWVVQEARRGRYRLGPALGELHRRWQAGLDRMALARPIVVELGRRVREYVILAEWTGGGVLGLLEAHPDRELVVRGEQFTPDRIHAMATGKLLLALLAEGRRREVVAALPLDRRGPASVTDRAVLWDQLAAIRQDGQAVCVEEAAAGVVALAVPVPTEPGQALTALGLSLPLSRYTAARRAELLAALREAAQAIAASWQ